MEESFVARLKIEKEELDTKIGKLDDFIAGFSFVKVDPLQQELLKAQLSIMTSYSAVLGLRLTHLS